MDITLLIYNVGILFVMMMPGLILKKCNLVPDGSGKGISALVLYVAQPTLVLLSYLEFEGTFADIWVNILVVFALSVIAHILFTLVAHLLFRGAPEGRRRMLRFATVFSNAAFMGIPLIKVLIGPEAAIYASIYNITFNVFQWTLGVHFCTYQEGQDLDRDGDADIMDVAINVRRSAGRASAIMKVAFHPVIIASILGVICLVGGINVKLIESAGLTFITDCLEMLSALVAPLAMVVIGLRVGEIDFIGAMRDKYMYVFLLMRHLILPLTLLGIIRIIGLFIPISDIALLVTMILVATPAASSATMFAEKYDCDATYTSQLVAVSTILSILTMPIIVSLTMV